MIPRILHITWVGDESRRPNRCIQTWKDQHPDWTVRIWGNAERQGRAWINGAHMKAMATREWNGVADLMRWEILFAEGGVLVDADSFCVKPLPEWLLTCEAFACWENEQARPGLIAAGYFGTAPGTPFLAALIQGIHEQPTVIDRMAWESVGPLHLTETWKKTGYANLTLLPSHFFIPRHFTGVEYTGGGPVYALQEWGSTLRRYDELEDGGSALAPGDAAAQGPGSGDLPPGQAFLHEPLWQEAEWAEIVLSYVAAFKPGDPVALLLILDPARAGQLPLAEAEKAVIHLLTRAGKASFPPIILLDEPTELAPHLRKFPQATWVPQGKGNTAGFRGSLGARFAKAREGLAVPK